MPRKVFGEQFAGFLHAVKYAGCEFGFAKMTTHGIRQFLPEFIPALRVNGGIADNGKLVRAGSHKNQHAVPCRRSIHAQTQKFLLRGSHRVVNMFRADADANFAGGFAFGITNRRDNVVVMQMRRTRQRCSRRCLPMRLIPISTSSPTRRRRQNCRRRRKIHRRRRIRHRRKIRPHLKNLHHPNLGLSRCWRATAKVKTFLNPG